LLLAMVAGFAVLRLLPYNLTQRDELERIRQEVSLAEQQVDQAQAEFDRYFDASQTERLAQESSGRMNRNQVQVIWVTPPEQ
jgi:hypothetical protein